MKHEFLFDSDNLEQRGKGVDRLGTKTDGLKLEWKTNHHQVAFANIGLYRLETVFWHTSYEARVRYRDEQMESVMDIYKTKLDAQLGAEKLLVKILEKGQKLLQTFK